MKNSDKPQEPDDGTSAIVRIAYRQSRAMSNSDNSEDSSKPQREGLNCTNRLKSLPIIASINSSITNVYTSVKGSHSTVETILNRTEEGLSEGVKIVSPVTSKIGESLEQPLKSIDTVICDSLDYLEKNVPSVKLPPGEIYENVEGYIKNISNSVKKHSNELYDDVKIKLDELTKGVEGENDKLKSPPNDRESTAD